MGWARGRVISLAPNFKTYNYKCQQSSRLDRLIVCETRHFSVDHSIPPSDHCYAMFFRDFAQKRENLGEAS